MTLSPHVLLATALASVVALSACSSASTASNATTAPTATAPATKAAPSQPVHIANPASVFCIQQSGKLRMEKTAQGERMLCILPNGQAVEEWAYFRKHHSTKQ